MGKDKYNISEEEFEQEKSRLKAEFKKNLELIKEIIPDYDFPESKIDRYITRERMELQRQVLEYNESVEENKIDFDPTMIPESYERSMYTFYDKSGSEEAKEKNRKILNDIQSPSAEGDRLRKRFFLDSLNIFQNLDPSGISKDKTFEEKADFLLKNIDICERGFEFQNINYAKTSSLGIRFSEEHEKNIKTIERKAVGIGGKARTIKSIIQSDLFLTFPFEDLTAEQTAVLAGSMQGLVMRKGASNKESMKYGQLLMALMLGSKELADEVPLPHVYTMDDAIDIKYDLPEVKEKLSSFYNRLIEAGTEEQRKAHKDISGLTDALSSAIDSLSDVNAGLTPQQAACIFKSASDLYLLAFRSQNNKLPENADDFERAINDLKKDICSFLVPNLTSKLLFESIVSRHNVLHCIEEDPAYFETLGAMIEKVIKCGLSYDQIRETAEDLNMSPQEFVKQASEDKIKWQLKKWEIKKIRADNEEKERDDRAKEVMEKYSIPKEFESLIRASEITAEEIAEFSFIKEAESQEDKNRALADYLKDGRKYAGSLLPEEYAKVLIEEELDYARIWSMALHQGITVDTYFNRMLGREDLSADPDHKPETIEQQYERNLKEINDQLRAGAKNPLETLMAETMLQMKEYSFMAGTRAEMEKCAARFVALEAVRQYAGLEKGESLEDDPERAVALSKVLANLDKHAADVYESDSFRYLMKTMDTADKLAALSRGNTTERLDKLCDAMKELERGNLLHTDHIVCMDKVRTYSEYAMRSEIFFPDKFTMSGKLIKDYPNPFRISVSRTGLVSLAYARMLEKGFDMEDILDPYRFIEVKKDIGREVFEMIRHEENRDAVINTYLAGYEKTLEYTNRQLSKLDSLNPADIVKLDEPAFFALSHLLKDYTQEVGKMKKDVPLSEENEGRLARLDNEGEGINKYLQAASKAVDKLISMASEQSFEDGALAYNQDFIGMAYLNKSFVKTKKMAEERGMTVSAFVYEETTEKPQDPSTALGMMEQGIMLAFDYANGMPRAVKREFETNKAVRSRISKDVFSGEFEKNLRIKTGQDGKHSITTDYYKKFVKDLKKDGEGPVL